MPLDQKAEKESFAALNERLKSLDSSKNLLSAEEEKLLLDEIKKETAEKGINLSKETEILNFIIQKITKEREVREASANNLQEKRAQEIAGEIVTKWLEEKNKETKEKFHQINPNLNPKEGHEYSAVSKNTTFDDVKKFYETYYNEHFSQEQPKPLLEDCIRQETIGGRSCFVMRFKTPEHAANHFVEQAKHFKTEVEMANSKGETYARITPEGKIYQGKGNQMIEPDDFVELLRRNKTSPAPNKVVSEIQQEQANKNEDESRNLSL